MITTTSVERSVTATGEVLEIEASPRAKRISTETSAQEPKESSIIASGDAAVIAEERKSKAALKFTPNQVSVLIVVDKCFIFVFRQFKLVHTSRHGWTL